MTRLEETERGIQMEASKTHTEESQDRMACHNHSKGQCRSIKNTRAEMEKDWKEGGNEQKLKRMEKSITKETEMVPESP